MQRWERDELEHAARSSPAPGEVVAWPPLDPREKKPMGLIVPARR